MCTGEQTFGSFYAVRSIMGASGALYTTNSFGGLVLLAEFERYGDAVAAARLFHIHTEKKSVY